MSAGYGLALPSLGGTPTYRPHLHTYIYIHVYIYISRFIILFMFMYFFFSSLCRFVSHFSKLGVYFYTRVQKYVRNNFFFDTCCAIPPTVDVGAQMVVMSFCLTPSLLVLYQRVG